MRLRTARRGPNAGSQFWGCSRYPDCQTVVQLEPASPGGDGPSSASPSPADTLAFPVPTAAAPRDRLGQSAFFQACGLPAAFVESLHMADVDRALVRSAAQWRLDFPLPHGDGVQPDDRGVLAVAEALLTRGAIPLCSPSLESELGTAAVPPEDAEPVIEALRRVACAPSSRLRPLSFDSHEERLVFDWVQGLVERNELPWSLIPQVELASLSMAIDPLSAQRGDILLVHPDRDPVLVEVDGAEHNAHRERDEARDRALNAAGVRVVRVQAGEAREGRGPTLDALERILLDGHIDLPPETELSTTVRWCKFFHQMQLALLAALRGGWLSFDTPWKVGVVLPRTLRGDPSV